MSVDKPEVSVNLENLRAAFDEHEVRTASFLERDLNNDERLNMGIDGLCQVCKEGRSILEFEAAAKVLEQSINDGQTVGAALVASVQSLK